MLDYLVLLARLGNDDNARIGLLHALPVAAQFIPSAKPIDSKASASHKGMLCGG